MCIRDSWQFDPRQRIRLTLQGSEVLRDQSLYGTHVNEAARDWAAQAVYSYKVNPRTAVYAGASYGAFMDDDNQDLFGACLLYTSPSPRDRTRSRMPFSA